MSAVPIPQAALALGISTVQLRRLLRQGAPRARQGSRGRGRATLVDPSAVEAWRASQRVTLAGAAAQIPDVLADALADALTEADGLPKQRMAAFLAGVWYAAATRCMDHLRAHDAAVPDVTAVPLVIERLRKISAA